MLIEHNAAYWPLTPLALRSLGRPGARRLQRHGPSFSRTAMQENNCKFTRSVERLRVLSSRGLVQGRYKELGLATERIPAIEKGIERL
jgi:hypothetical protein